MSDEPKPNEIVQVKAEPVRMRELLAKDGAIEIVTQGNVAITISLPLLRQLTRVSGTREPATAELVMFGNMCVEDRLNPYKKECWLVWMQGGYEPVVSAQARLRKAQQQSDYDGYMWGYITEDGKRHGSGKDSTALPAEVIGIWGEVARRGISTPYYHETFMDEYKKGSKSGESNWDKKSITMLMKVNRDQTHKFAYADVMGNLCTENELNVDPPRAEYENRTLPREQRKAIASTSLPPEEGQQAGSEAIHDAAAPAMADQGTISKMLLGLLDMFAEKLPRTLEQADLDTQFLKWVSFENGGNREDYRNPSAFDLPLISKLKNILEKQGIDQVIIDELPAEEQ
jgi:hypothetical protein